MNFKKKLLSVEELAEFLDVPKSWIYRKTFERKIPHVKLGKYVRFHPEEIEQWVKEKEVGSFKSLSDESTTEVYYNLSEK